MRLCLVPVLTLALLVAAPSGAAAYPNAFGPISANPADALAHLPIERGRYDRATGCRGRSAPGALSLARWLGRNSRGTSWGIYRCERWGKGSASLHAEGRALDWHLDVRNPADARAAKRLITMLLAPDRNGRPAALARRMGVQEIIWDCRSWFGGTPSLGRYSACYSRSGKLKKKVGATVAHRDHVHLGLTRAGARRATSFWTRRAPGLTEREHAPEQPEEHEPLDALDPGSAFDDGTEDWAGEGDDPSQEGSGP